MFHWRDYRFLTLLFSVLFFSFSPVSIRIIKRKLDSGSDSHNILEYGSRGAGAKIEMTSESVIAKKGNCTYMHTRLSSVVGSSGSWEVFFFFCWCFVRFCEATHYYECTTRDYKLQLEKLQRQIDDRWTICMTARSTDRINMRIRVHLWQGWLSSQ